MTYITLIYAALHNVTQPNIATMIHKTSITPDYVTQPNIAEIINKTCIMPDHVTFSNLV
jgi:hypothetical protein